MARRALVSSPLLLLLLLLLAAGPATAQRQQDAQDGQFSQQIQIQICFAKDPQNEAFHICTSNEL